MARPKGIPSYRHHKASGRAFVRFGNYNHYLGFYGTMESKAEYDRIIREWLANGRQFSHQEQHQPITINGLCIAFLEYADGYYRKNGRRTSEYAEFEASVKLLHDHCGMSPAAEFTRQSLKAIRETAVAKGWKRYTVNKRISRIKHIIHWGADEELIPASAYHDVQLLKGLKKGRCGCPESVPVESVPLEDFKKTLEFCSAMIADMARIQYLGAMRPGEVCELRACDIDTSGNIWECDYKEHKTSHSKDRPRLIWLCLRAQEILTPYLMDAEDDPEKYLFSPKEAVRLANVEKRSKRKSKVQPSQISRAKEKPKRGPGDHYRESSYRQALQRAAEKAGVERWFPHQLRHLRATEIERQYGTGAAQVILGHENPNVTQIYIDRDREKAISVMKKIDNHGI